MAVQELAGVHVLVVEDTDDSREMLRIAREYFGALVTTAESVEKAKRVLETLRPHVLVTDIAMPDDGLEMIREVKRLAEMNDLHIPTISQPSRLPPTGVGAKSFWPRGSLNCWRNP
jgi:CheY-like chemotaxis protein